MDQDLHQIRSQVDLTVALEVKDTQIQKLSSQLQEADKQLDQMRRTAEQLMMEKKR